MLPFRAKSIRATTRTELDAALASPSAQSVIVEGDDDLLTYAARKASGDPDLRIGGGGRRAGWRRYVAGRLGDAAL
jgi:hypothetical protein